MGFVVLCKKKTQIYKSLCCAGLFEQRVEQYLEELPDTEQSGVNKFLKGLGKRHTAAEVVSHWLMVNLKNVFSLFL